MRTALLQLNVSDDPAENLISTRAMVESALADGAGFVLTPECTNCGRSIDFLPEGSTKEERLRALREEDRKASAVEKENYRGEFKTGTFVLLAIFFWPAAIWYLFKNNPLRKV